MRYRIALYVCLVCFGFLAIANVRPAHAADQLVTDCDNYTGPTNDVPITLDEAVANAIATGGGIITFACPSGTVINMNFEMFISLNSVVINGGGNVTLDASNTNRIAYINPGATLDLRNIVIRNGVSMTGGALRNDGTLLLDTVTVQNSRGSEGGAIYNASGRPLTITNSTFTGNQATSGSLLGGAIYNVGTANITNTIFSNNGWGGNGGAIYNVGMMNLAGFSFSNNTATNGGAIYSTGMLGMIGGSFSNNSALTSGGAIYNAGTTSSQNVVYTNNTCTFTAMTDNGGNTRDSASVGCPGSITLSASAVCVGATLNVTITSGDANFDIIASGITIHSSVGTGVYTYPGGVNLTSITVTELSGDTQSLNLGDLFCQNTLVASAICVGPDLLVTITAGDGNFVISADSGNLHPSAPIGTQTFFGPRTETNVTVRELGGNVETANLGDYDCFPSAALTATAVCVDDDLQITITNGNAPFSISVTDSGGTTDLGSLPLGSYTFNGPDTFTSIGITEDAGDLETLNFLDITCTAPVIPPAPVVLSPDLTALGCVLTQDVLAPDAPDNTYCRVLMKNGAVINYSGAVPRPLVDLGVIYAVDVYRLEGGQSITSFPNYTRVCLGGLGRLFYLDARTSPRSMTELTTETLDGMTCGWIPAVGTLVLTQ